MRTQENAELRAHDEPQLESSDTEIYPGLIVTLSNESKAVLRELIEPIASRPYSNDLLSEYLDAAEKVWQRKLPELVLVHSLLTSGCRRALLISNLPTDSAPPPTGPGCRPAKQTAYAESVSAVLLHPLGRLITYGDKRDGAVVSDLYPKQSDSGKQLGTGAVFLEWHTDEAFHRCPPTFVSLFGIRGESTAKTLIADFDLDQLAPEVMGVLRRELFTIVADDSHSVPGQRIQTALITFNQGEYALRYDPIFTSCHTPEAQHAFDAFKRFALSRAMSFTINTGEALIFNNRMGVHARTDMQARFDGTDRWVSKAQVVPANTPDELFETRGAFWLKPQGK